MMKICKELYSYREMIANLVQRELRGRYRGSILGFLWTFLNPLLQLAVYTFVFQFILQSPIPKYYLFLFVGLVPWIFFSSCLTAGATSVLAQKDLVKKIYFPRLVLPIATVTTNFINMLLTFVIIFIVVIIEQVPLSFLSVLCLIVIMLIEYIFALGITLITSAVTVYFRDLEHILGIVSMVWMYVTPIMYSVDSIPEQFRSVFNLNPMTPIISGYRDVLYYGRAPEMATMLQALILGIIFLFLGVFIFNKLQKHFVEEL